MQCSRCGFQNSPGAGYCAQCGNSLVSAPPPPAQPGQVCYNCGTQNSYGTRFCAGCGQQLVAFPPVPQKRPFPWLLIVGIIGVILCLLLLGIVGFAYFFGPENIIISPFK